MTFISGLVMSLWLGFAPSSGENWRGVYVLSRARVYVVKCGTRQGAGFLFHDRKSIVTSLSVAGCGRQIWIFRHPGDTGLPAALHAYRSKYDVALVRTEQALPGEPLEGAQGALTSIGQKVALIGHPYNPDGALLDRLKAPLSWSLNVGVLGRVSKNYLQVQIHRVPGYSGAPVLDRRGRVLGMLTRFGPGGRPIGMSVRMPIIRSLFTKQPIREGWPFLSWEFHAHARFSLALGQSKNTAMSPTSQELRLDLIFQDRWDLGIFVGFDLLGLRTDLDLSVLGGLSIGHRFLMPRFSRPYLNYISIELGALFMLMELATKGTNGTVDQVRLSSFFRLSVWLGLRFYSAVGQFSLGLFFDLDHFIDPKKPITPVLSISWGV